MLGNGISGNGNNTIRTTAALIINAIQPGETEE